MQRIHRRLGTTGTILAALGLLSIIIAGAALAAFLLRASATADVSTAAGGLEYQVAGSATAALTPSGDCTATLIDGEVAVTWSGAWGGETCTVDGMRLVNLSPDFLVDTFSAVFVDGINFGEGPSFAVDVAVELESPSQGWHDLVWHNTDGLTLSQYTDGTGADSREARLVFTITDVAEPGLTFDTESIYIDGTRR